MASLLTASCFADLSTVADHEIPDIVIEGLEPELRVLYGETVHVEVSVSQKGRSAADFDIRWSVDLTAGKIKDRIEICEGPVLDYKVSNTPSDRPYALRVDVTDKQTGLVQVAWSRLYVSTSLGEGILVAYTNDGGKTTEFDIIRNQYITYAYEGDETQITRALYSLANEESLEEKVICMAPVVDTDMETLNETRILLGTSDHLISIDPLTFKEMSRDATLFQSANQTSYETTALFNFGSYQAGAIVGGYLYVIPTILDRVFGQTAFSLQPKNIFNTRNVAYAAYQGGHLAVFDEVHERFFYVIGNFAHNASFEELSPEKLSFSLSGCSAVAAGETKGKNLAFIVKDPTGVNHLCVVDVSGSNPAISSTDVIVDGERFEEAVSIAFCDNADIFYYATPDALYATLFAIGRISTRKVNWTPDSPDEKITSVRQYTQAFKGTQNLDPSSYPYILPTHRLQMIITTYNDKTGEGKIYLRPFNVSTGLFTSKNNGTYGGFGEITALCPTFR